MLGALVGKAELIWLAALFLGSPTTAVAEPPTAQALIERHHVE